MKSFSKFKFIEKNGSEIEILGCDTWPPSNGPASNDKDGGHPDDLQ